MSRGTPPHRANSSINSFIYAFLDLAGLCILHLDAYSLKYVLLARALWSILIIKELFDGKEPMRFNELMRKLDPISSRTLSKKLTELKRYEVIERVVEHSSPPSTYYSMSEKGKDLAKVIRSLAEWSLKWHKTETEKSW